MAEASTNLEVVITAKDEASSKIAGLTSQLQNNKVALAGIAATAGLAFAGIASFAQSSIEAAQDSAEKQAQLAAVLKSTAGAAGVNIEALNAQAQALQKTTTYSDEAVNSVQALLLTFTNIKGEILTKTTPAILDMATALHEDTQSAAIQVGKALNDPIKGITALSKVGVSFTQQQKDVIKSLVDTGNTAGAQTLILNELSKEFGGSATAAAQTYGGQIEILKNQLNDTQEDIGRALIPVILELLKAVLPIVTAVADWISKNPELTKWIIILGGGLTALTAVVATLTLAVVSFDVAMLPVAAVVIGIVAAIGGLIFIAYNLYQIVQDLYVLWPTAWKAIEDTAKTVAANIVSFFQPMINIFDSVVSKLEAIYSAAQKAASAVGGAVSGAVSSVVGHKAAGGTVSSGSSYVVGENGPEIFTPGFSGSIAPNSQFAPSGGVSVVIQGGVFMSPSAAEQMGDLIIKKLMRKTRLGT